MLVYYSSLDLEEGFELLSLPDKKQIKIGGMQMSRPSGWNLFRSLRGKSICCVFCGVEASIWVAVRGRRDANNHPVINLFSRTSSQLEMLTQDHIIPKSLGGKDVLENLRPCCSRCNAKRGNTPSPGDIDFALKHPELIDAERLRVGKQSMLQRVAELEEKISNLSQEISRLKKPFQDMKYI